MGLDVRLRTRRIIPSDSLALAYCRSGDLEGIDSLLRAYTVGIDDVDSSENNLLHVSSPHPPHVCQRSLNIPQVALNAGQMNMARRLFVVGVDQHWSNKDGM